MPLSSLDARRLRGAAAEADALGRLQPRQRALIHHRDWLRALAPRACGGGERALPEMVRLEEAIATADGSCGWVVTLCAGAGWFAGFLPPTLARELMATPHVCLAGSGAPGGVAEREGTGWRLHGAWQFASGADMATHFTCNAVLHEGGRPLRDAQGAPRLRAFVVDAAQVRVRPSWRSLGLRASATHGFEIEPLWLPAERAFRIEPEAATADGPLWRFPFVPLAWVTLAANLAGMARAFLDEAAGLATPTDKPRLAALLAPESLRLATAREAFYRQLDAAWAQVVAGQPLGEATALALQAVSATLVHTARRAVDEVYPGCGLRAAHEASTLNRLWRDLHTATQHALLAP